MQSLAISFQSAVLPVTARKDFWSRSCPSALTRHLPLLDSFLVAPIAPFFIGTSRSHPLIHFGQLKLPQPSDPMRGKPLAFPPAINGVLGNTQVLGNVFGGNPRFNTHVDGALPALIKVVEDRFKSTSRALAKHPFAVESRGSEAGAYSGDRDRAVRQRDR